MQVAVHNNLDRFAYLRYEGLSSRPLPLTDRAVYIAPQTNSASGGVAVAAHYRIKPGDVATFTFDTGENYKGCNIWADKDGSQHDAGGPTCSQLEFSIVDKELTFDITQLEGLCHGYKAVLNGGDMATCGYNESASGARTWPSDKHVGSGTWQLNAGCSKATMAKDCCHRFIARNSYSPGGFCNALHSPEAKCNAYCWAYDEKRCVDADTCTFDGDCNPTDPLGHPPVLHVNPVTNESQFDVYISELDPELYNHMQRSVRANYGETTDEPLCGNPGTCGASGSGWQARTNTVLIVVVCVVIGLALLMFVTHRRV